jgi:hypothetical protein
VAIASDDVQYKEQPDKQVLEARIVEKMFSTVQGGICQGIYVATPSGKLISRVNAGWPDPDAKQILVNINQATQRYYQMPKSERLFSQVPDPVKDRIAFKKDQFYKPNGTLDLRVTKRGYSYPGMTTFDERHPKFLGFDRLWFKPSEWQQFFPQNIKVGSKTQIKGIPFERWVIHNHMQKGHNAWEPDHIKSGSMVTEVTGIAGNLVDLSLKASYSMKADTKWNTGAYDGSLMGKIQYDLGANKFTKFEVVMLGWHHAGKFLDNARSGELTQWVSSYTTINPHNDADDRMIPGNWMWGYGLNWCKTR